jgi:hypothetical protein
MPSRTFTTDERRDRDFFYDHDIEGWGRGEGCRETGGDEKEKEMGEMDAGKGVSQEKP